MRWLLLLGTGWLLACASAPRGAAKAQEQAHEFNLHARFGRLELAAEQIAKEQREAVMASRRAWGKALRVVDLELLGVKSLDAEHREVEIWAQFSWYRVREGDLKQTLLKQRWREHHGNYLLVAEERVEGDVGLLGEAVTVQTPSQAEAPRAYFPTVRLRGEVRED